MINGNNSILDNGKKYIRINLLKVPVGSISDDKPKIIEKAKTDQKVKQTLKSNDHTDAPLVSRLRRRPLQREAKNK